MVLVFTGSNDLVSMPLSTFDRYLAPVPASVVYLKDFNRLRFLTGIRSLAADYSGTVSALRQMRDRLGARRVCAIGNCYGGFAAIRYGVELGAERILAFSAMTHGPRETEATQEQTRKFVSSRLAAKVPADMIDLAPFLATRSHRGRIEVFYDGDDPRDASHASRLGGFAGVRLHRRAAQGSGLLLRRIALESVDFCGTLAGLMGLERATEVSRDE